MSQDTAFWEKGSERVLVRGKSSGIGLGTLDAFGAGAVAGDAARVLIVSRNANTAAELGAYFDQRGVPVALSDDLVCSQACEPLRAVVVFPDEFPAYLASRSLRKLARRFDRAWLCVVTRNVVRFERLAEELGNGIAERWLVLPRPTWGFRLLERVLAPLPAGEASSRGGSDTAKGVRRRKHETDGP